MRKPLRPTWIKTATGELTAVESVGDIIISMHTASGERRFITLTNVLYVPNLAFNLISVKQLWKHNRLKTVFGDTCYFKDKNTSEKYSFPGSKGSLYSIPGRAACAATTSVRLPWKVVHARLGHCGPNRMKLAHKLCHGVPETQGDPEQCGACLRGGAKKRPFGAPKPRRPRKAKEGAKNAPERKYTRFGQRVDSDLCSGFPPSVGHGHNYALNFYDLATKTSDIYFLKTKEAESVRACFKKFERKYKKELRQR